MKVLILAGGLGSRMGEETTLVPKPMLEIGGKPILWHIMKTYSHFGFNDFVILLGYKGYYIKEYFLNYYLHSADVHIDMVKNETTYLNTAAEPWKITLLDTGLQTMTGGRIKRAAEYIGNEPFLLTYGDGVADIDINALIAFHKNHKKLITLTSVQPEGRFGALEIEADQKVSRFLEKIKGDGAWINGGYFMCEPEVLNYLKHDESVLEQEPLMTLAAEGNLFTYQHNGFWKCMDTHRDKQQLNTLWENGNAPWKRW